MVPSVACRDEREREVVRLWRNGHLGRGTTVTYLQWVRLYRAYCRQRHIDETAELTLDGAVRFTRAYVGPRKKGPVASRSGEIAWRALRAWSCALRSLRVSVPEWRPKRVSPRLSPLLTAYCQYRRGHRGVAEGTLGRDIEVAKAFLSLLRDRSKTVARATVADIDAFVSALAASISRRSVADRCSSLRSFLRFLHTTGRSVRNLAPCVAAPRVRIPARAAVAGRAPHSSRDPAEATARQTRFRHVADGGHIRARSWRGVGLASRGRGLEVGNSARPAAEDRRRNRPPAAGSGYTGLGGLS